MKPKKEKTGFYILRKVKVSPLVGEKWVIAPGKNLDSGNTEKLALAAEQLAAEVDLKLSLADSIVQLLGQGYQVVLGHPLRGVSASKEFAGLFGIRDDVFAFVSGDGRRVRCVGPQEHGGPLECYPWQLPSPDLIENARANRRSSSRQSQPPSRPSRQQPSAKTSTSRWEHNAAARLRTLTELREALTKAYGQRDRAKAEAKQSYYSGVVEALEWALSLRENLK